jgi:hypothetical protein
MRGIPVPECSRFLFEASKREYAIHGGKGKI